LELNDAMDQMDLADFYRVFHTTAAQYTFFSAAHGTFSKVFFPAQEEGTTKHTESC
jgi:hypothetical protein